MLVQLVHRFRSLELVWYNTHEISIVLDDQVDTVQADTTHRRVYMQ